ncbi:MAG TPA: DUF1501 domain-containing protein [Gammaproteobacteria bacterium]|nr:DUF1501 domain-containing protein [Gammaproteobacteria bacterium]
MKRRTLLKALSQIGALPLIGMPVMSRALTEGSYMGPLLLQIQADGGWDVTSYCDPKVNQPGENPITNWSISADPLAAGGIQFAPFANNQMFFERHHQKMLVINGVDMQTNSHTTGVLHNWSGRNSEGYPVLTALFAAQHAPTIPMPYVNFGGFGATENVIRYTRLEGNPDRLRQVLEPNIKGYYTPHENNDYDEPIYYTTSEELELLGKYRRARFQRLMQNDQLLSREAHNLDAYVDAIENRKELKSFASYLPTSDERIEDAPMIYPNMKAQVQIISAAFSAGVSCSADLQLGGFDTHDDHDNLHAPLLSYLNESIDLIWQLAEAGGYADRLTVVIGSDFSRTPNYNSQMGKDHWPIGSVIVMQVNPDWGSRTVGETDPLHNVKRINPTSLQSDDASGSIIYPRHVHKALRQLVGLGDTDLDQRFPFNNTELFNFFA